MYTDTSQPAPGYIPPQEDPWWQEAISWLGSLFSGEYPKPLPPPLPFTAQQIQGMMAADPFTAAALLATMKAQGHTALFLGHQPTASDWGNPATTAALALWFANGTGDDLSRGEAQIRQLVIQGMQGQAPTSGGGGTTNWPPVNIPGGPTTAALGPLIALAAAGLFFTRKGKR